jgi:tetratricopeptide (TPR) repeat protein
MMGQIYIQMHRYEDAVMAFSDTAAVADNHLASTAYNNIGVAYSDMSAARAGAEKEALLMKAAEAFRKSADLDDRMLFAFDSYVNVLYQGGKKDDLERELQSKLNEKQDYRAYYGLGKLALLSGDYTQAVRYFDEANRLNPRQKLISFNEAYALNQLKRRDEAIVKYLETIRLDPLFVQARHNLALLYMQVGELSKAIDGFENALRLDPNYLSAHLNLAKIYIQTGNRGAARDHLSKVLSLAPEQQEAALLWRQLGS